MTPKIARTESTPTPPPPKNVGKVCTTCPKMAQKSCNPLKWEEHACLPKFSHVPPGFYGLLMFTKNIMIEITKTCKGTVPVDVSFLFMFLPSLDLSLISGVPCVKIKAINQFSVYLLRIPSLHYLAETGLHVSGSLKEQFWTLA